MSEVKESPFTDRDTCPCGAPLIGHLKCDGCGILLVVPVEEPGEFVHSFLPIPYRGKILCRLCVRGWVKREKQLGRKISWEEYKTPRKANGDETLTLEVDDAVPAG